MDAAHGAGVEAAAVEREGQLELRHRGVAGGDRHGLPEVAVERLAVSFERNRARLGEVVDDGTEGGRLPAPEPPVGPHVQHPKN